MENEFVTYEIAKLLKELNFDEPCLAWYYFNEENSSYALNSFKQDYGDKFDWWKYSELDSDVYVDHLIAPLWQQVIDWFDSKGLLVGTIIVDNLYKSTINKINYETGLFNSRNESIKRAIEFAISYLQDSK